MRAPALVNGFDVCFLLLPFACINRSSPPPMLAIPAPLQGNAEAEGEGSTPSSSAPAAEGEATAAEGEATAAEEETAAAEGVAAEGVAAEGEVSIA